MDKLRILKNYVPYTIASFTNLGFPYSLHFTLKGMRYGIDPAQPDGYLLMFKVPKNKTLFLYPDKPFIIWEGAVYPDVDRLVSRHIRDYDSGSVAVGRTWPGFNVQYMQKAMDSLSKQPLIVNFKIVPVKQGELFSPVEVIS